MSKISIVSNLQCTSIFTVRIDDDLVSVLAWEQGRRTQQFNFHPLTRCDNQYAARLRARALGSNLSAVTRRMEYAEVPRDECERFYTTVADIIDGWVSDWFISNFEDTYTEPSTLPSYEADLERLAHEYGDVLPDGFKLPSWS